jgi:AcrR family transcriptional regulator
MPKPKRPIVLTRRALYERVWSEPLSTIAAEMGVSGNALAKICNRLLVPYPTRGYWNKVSAGKRAARAPLPAAPELQTREVTISSTPAASRRSRTRLDPNERREQLLETAARLVRTGGLAAATMKGVAASTGISETQAYNYFKTREALLVELARREFARIQEARVAEMAKVDGLQRKIIAGTLTYLRQIDERGALLQMLIRNSTVRESLRPQKRKRDRAGVDSHATTLADRYGISKAMATARTIVISRLCLRAGKLIADKRIPLESAEKLCLAMVLQSSVAFANPGDDFVRQAQPLEAA